MELVDLTMIPYHPYLDMLRLLQDPSYHTMELVDLTMIAYHLYLDMLLLLQDPVKCPFPPRVFHQVVEGADLVLLHSLLRHVQSRRVPGTGTAQVLRLRKGLRHPRISVDSN